VKIIDNHSSINMDSIRFVTWSRFKRFWRKRYRGSKNICGVITIVYNKAHQPNVVKNNSGFLLRSSSSFLSFVFHFFFLW